MKTEDFDNAIRRKLESINTVHEHQAVNAVYDYVQSKKGKASKKRVAIILLASSFLVIMSLLFAWNIFQANEISSLKKHISKLTVKNRTDDTSKENENAERSSGVRKETPIAIAVKTSKFPVNAKSNLKMNAVTFTSRGKSVQIKVDGNSKIPYTSKKVKTNSLSSVTNSLFPEDDVKKQTTIASGVKLASGDPRAKELVDEKESKLFIQELEVEKQSDTAAMISETEKSLLAPDSSITINLIVDSSSGKPATEHPVYPKLWNYRIGLGFEKGNNQLGGSILGEAIYKKRIAISAGFKVLKNGEESFDDDDDYDDHKMKKFKETYGNQVDDDSKNIKIRNTLFQIPITLSYIFPLKANFSILAGLGTDIDVYTKQHVQYHAANVANDLQTTQFVTKSPPAYFNNVVITAGIQKKIHRFILQLSPYVSPQLKKVDYKKYNCYFGLKLRALFEF